MSDRSRVVGMMLKATRQIVAREEFVEDAMWCAEMTEITENNEGVAALRAKVVACRIKAALMRDVMGQLATVLTRLPLEPA